MFSGECWTLRFAWRSTLSAFTSFYTWKRFRWRWTSRSMISMARPWRSTKQTRGCLFSMWVRSEMIVSNCVLVYVRCCYRYHDVSRNFGFLNVIFSFLWLLYLCLSLTQVPGVAENRPSVLRGDKLNVCVSQDRNQRVTVYEGYVHCVELERVKLGFSNK